MSVTSACLPLAIVAATLTVKRTLSPTKLDSGACTAAIARSNGGVVPPTMTDDMDTPIEPSLRATDSTPASPVWRPSVKNMTD